MKYEVTLTFEIEAETDATAFSRSVIRSVRALKPTDAVDMTMVRLPSREKVFPYAVQ